MRPAQLAHQGFDERRLNPDNWRLRLQTSGIYRDPAIPGRKLKVKTGGSAAGAASRPGLAPEVSAQVASLQSLVCDRFLECVYFTL